MLENKFLMIKPKQMQYRSMKIIYVYRIFQNIISQLISFPVGEASCNVVAG
mgnify:CR=1 FL=1